jgi:hypothetical protein
MVDRRPVGVATGVGLGDHTAGQRVLRVAEREAGDVDLGAGLVGLGGPFEEGQVATVDLDDGEVGTLGDTEHPGVARLVLAVHRDLQQAGAGDDVVVGDGDARRVDDETRAAAGTFDGAELRVDERADGLDLDDRAADVLEIGHRAGGRAVGIDGRVRAVVGDGGDRAVLGGVRGRRPGGSGRLDVAGLFGLVAIAVALVRRIVGAARGGAGRQQHDGRR